MFCNSQVSYREGPCQWMNDNGDEEWMLRGLYWQKDNTAEVHLTILIKI